MDEETRQLIRNFPAQDETLAYGETISEADTLEVVSYPDDEGDTALDETKVEIEAMVQAANEQIAAALAQHAGMPLGYVSNARNAAAQSDTFQFWAPAEATSLGIGSIVRHTASIPQIVHTYGIVVDTEGSTLGLDDFAIHVYERDAQPPVESILPAPSTRRPIVNYYAKVLASTQGVHRPVLSGPVYAVAADELAGLHRKDNAYWLDPDYFLTGFYEDASGEFGIFAEERSRVLGPKQGHMILSGLPGAGKTSLFLTLIISLYAQLRTMEEKDADAED
jgi:hypothetical protein